MSVVSQWSKWSKWSRPVEVCDEGQDCHSFPTMSEVEQCHVVQVVVVVTWKRFLEEKTTSATSEAHETLAQKNESA